jgi:hypothetical protein
MACIGRYASATEYNDLLGAQLDLDEPAVLLAIETALDISASDVHMALASVGACSCTLDTWALTYLKKLNIMDAAVIQNAPCGQALTDDQKKMFLDWINGQFELIRVGKIDVCAGSTGKDYPYGATAEIAWTEFSQSEIIRNRLSRLP